MIPPRKPIICPHCHQDSGIDEKSIMMLVIRPPGLLCKNCGEVAVKAPPQPMLSEQTLEKYDEPFVAQRASPLSATMRDKLSQIRKKRKLEKLRE